MIWGIAIFGVITAMILSRVDNWSRDFSTNVARTGESTSLQPMLMAMSLDEATTKLRKAVDAMSNWQWTGETKADASVTVDLVRSTTVFRFKDDVKVTLSVDDSTSGVIVNAISRSQVGKGDLGQNPRNIRELFDRLGKG